MALGSTRSTARARPTRVLATVAQVRLRQKIIGELFGGRANAGNFVRTRASPCHPGMPPADARRRRFRTWRRTIRYGARVGWVAASASPKRRSNVLASGWCIWAAPSTAVSRVRSLFATRRHALTGIHAVVDNTCTGSFNDSRTLFLPLSNRPRRLQRRPPAPYYDGRVDAQEPSAAVVPEVFPNFVPPMDDPHSTHFDSSDFHVRQCGVCTRPSARDIYEDHSDTVVL